MHDIDSRADIDLLVSTFYNKLLVDLQLKHFFTDVIPINLEEHLPVICDFWESILLGNMVYRGNVMHKHLDLHRLSSLSVDHFDRWLFHWKKTVATLFAGPRADEALKRANLMAQLMQFKIEQSENPNFIQ